MAGKPTLTIRAIERSEPGSFYLRTRLKELVRDRETQRQALESGGDLVAYLDAELALIEFITSRAEASDDSDPEELIRLLSEDEFDDLAGVLLGNRPAPSATTNGKRSPVGLAARDRGRGGTKSS